MPRPTPVALLVPSAIPVDPTVPLPEIVAGPATNVPLPVYTGVPDEALVVFIKPEPPEWVGGDGGPSSTGCGCSRGIVAEQVAGSGSQSKRE